MKVYMVLFVLGLLLLAVPALTHAQSDETYTYISQQDGYLAGTIVVNGSIVFAGSNHVWQFKNGTFAKVYTSSGKVISDIFSDGKYIYLSEVELEPRSSGTVYDNDGISNPDTPTHPVPGNDTDGNSSSSGTQEQYAPDAPQSLSATYDSTNDEIVLTWYPPAYDGNSTITKYNLYKGPNQEKMYYFASVSAQSGMMTYKDTDVPSAGSTVYYFVTAVNSVGESPGSNEVYVTIPSNNSGGGSSGVQPQIQTTTDTTNFNAGYNATNFTIVKMNDDFSVVDTYVLSNITLYEAEAQLVHAAQIFEQDGNLYLAISGEDVAHTSNYTTMIYELSNGQFILKLSTDKYITEIVNDEQYFYMRVQNKEIDVYDSSFALKYSRSDISGTVDEYESMYAANNSLYIVGSSYGLDGEFHAMYLVVNSTLSSVEYYRTWNATGGFYAVDSYANHTAMVDENGRLYLFHNPYVLFSGRTDPSYVKNLNTGNYIDISNSALRVQYMQMYGDSANSSLYHYVWGGYYQTWDGHVYMFITMTDRSNDWIDLRGVGGWLMATYKNYTDWFMAGVAIVLIVAVFVYIDARERHKKHRRWRL